MASTFKGYDPKLGRKFAEESNGLVIGRARSSPQKSEAQASEDYSREHGRAPDAQQLHDWMTSKEATPAQQSSETPSTISADQHARSLSDKEMALALGYAWPADEN